MMVYETLAGETICPKCNSLKVEYNKEYGFYRCESCGETWAFDKDDPDYDEDDDEYGDSPLMFYGEDPQ
ncbi:hypothetical protein NIES4101_46060 [Calothrix sp. NIES-4101]|nr:hypothetical protein NIES4101_46060 [Calothrix sp. NIES-4101]